MVVLVVDGGEARVFLAHRIGESERGWRAWVVFDI